MSTRAAPEFWLSLAPFARPGAAAETARLTEAQGWDGLTLSDSQHVAPDVFVSLGIAAAATTTLKLATGVTNPVTRTAAACAGAIATVHLESGGRAVLGVGRGDSALAHLGRPPAPVAELEPFLRKARAYLRGDTVDEAGAASTLRWLTATSDLAPVPVDVAATGPRVIALAGATADVVTFAVGADVGRVREGIDLAREAALAAGRDPAGLRFGAWINMAAHADVAVARSVVAGRVSTFARFSGMHGAPTERLAPDVRAAVESLVEHYELARHGRTDSPQAQVLDDDFVDRFAVVGTATQCVQRLGAFLDELPELDRIVVASGHRGPAEAQRREVVATMAAEVLPALRR